LSLNKVLEKKPLFVTLNEQYTKSAELDNLQKKKEVLASLRDLYKPIDFKKVEEEQKIKEDRIREKNEERKRQLLEFQRKNEETYDFRKFTSRYTNQVLEEENEKQENEQRKEDHKRNLHQKMRSYNETTRQMYAPVVSARKQEEVHKRRQSLEMPAKEKYKNYTLISDRDEKKRIYEERIKAYQNMPKKQLMTPVDIKQNSSVDYLKELREHRVSNSNADTRPKCKK